ncbi:MAG: NAD(P)-dependent alcohol dehydrogenase [Deltaproteobacteria bacterium]|nr:NAD(P)-dependent alcohol dehydrogenase [Deltaproteobacteria bacterium]
MKAAYREQYADPLTVRDVARPEVRPDEILVEVHATTVNRTDCAVVTGEPFVMRFFTGLLKPTSPTPGTDFAGEVVAVGEKVSLFEKGQRVFGFNDQGLSSQAEYVAVSEQQAVAEIPATVSYRDAAASLEAAHYAYNFLSKVKLAPGQRVLVNGATGGIGSATVQFLRHAGVRVTATANTKNLELVRGLGAERVIDFETEDFTRIGERFDFVFDAVGKSTFGECRRLLEPKGVYISSELGPYLQNPLLALVTPLLPGKTVKFPLPVDIKRSMRFIAELLVSGAFKPVVDRSYPLARIAEAYAYVASGAKTGNVLVDVR